MIKVFHYLDGSLEVEGHANSQTELGQRVCAGVSLITSTLFVDYRAQLPQEGEFSYCPQGPSDRHAAEFSYNALKLLAEKHPEEITITEMA